jgi:hypothetical protein
MSFLKRLFGGGATRQLDVDATFFPRTRDDAAVEVVGEAYRQQDVIAARPPGPEDLPPGLPAPSPGYYKAMLVPEPTNEYDRNAISVLVWAGQTWSMCGYLSRFDAERYQPLFRAPRWFESTKLAGDRLRRGSQIRKGWHGVRTAPWHAWRMCRGACDRGRRAGDTPVGRQVRRLHGAGRYDDLWRATRA